MGYSNKRIFLLIFLCPFHLFSQTDSLQFTLEEYIDNILLFHPLAKNADLKIKSASANLLNAKGSFEPNIQSSWNEKNFDKKTYYRQFETKLNIPTILGLDFTAGYENMAGTFLNPENKTDEYGLWNVGLELNVLQGLVFNERQTALKQAKTFINLAQNEKQIMLNDLLLNAISAYYEWQKYYYLSEIIDENYQIATNYLANTKTAFFLGEKTAMDTLEAFIAFQEAAYLEQNNQQFLFSATQKLENFLWFNEYPIELQKNTYPEPYTQNLDFSNLNIFSDSLSQNNPSILVYDNKLKLLEIEQKLKQQKLLPKLKIKYNQLLNTSDSNIIPNYSLSNYKWGFDFSFPLLLRSERAEIQLTKIKMAEIEYELQNKNNEIQNKLKASVQKIIIQKDQINLINDKINGYKLLLDGENTKFNFGESSFFLLNKRQEKYISEKMKWVDENTKLRKEMLQYLYEANLLF